MAGACRSCALELEHTMPTASSYAANSLQEAASHHDRNRIMLRRSVYACNSAGGQPGRALRAEHAAQQCLRPELIGGLRACGTRVCMPDAMASKSSSASASSSSSSLSGGPAPPAPSPSPSDSRPLRCSSWRSRSVLPTAAGGLAESRSRLRTQRVLSALTWRQSTCAQCARASLKRRLLERSHVCVGHNNTMNTSAEAPIQESIPPIPLIILPQSTSSII